MTGDARESAFTFPCDGDRLVAILHQPETVHGPGIVIIVGGPQYRVGSHRQFLLLARRLAAAGYPVLRFDYRGMGDSDGEARDFEAIEADILAASAELRARAGVDRVVWWGLCDAASAALMAASHDAEVAGLALVNPWVHTEQGEATVRLKHYYRERLRSREFWSKLFGGALDWRDTLASLGGYLRTARRGAGDGGGGSEPGNFIERMRQRLAAFDGPVLLVLSGRDLTAREFESHCERSPQWQRALAAATIDRNAVVDADHTFSSAELRARLEDLTLAWLEQLRPAAAPARSPAAPESAT